MSLIEIGLVILVGIILLKPKDLIWIIKQLRSFWSYINELKQELMTIVDELEGKEKKDIHEPRNVKLIIGDDGQYYESYDIEEIKKDKNDQI